MKYLCLAYGAEKDWRALTTPEQEALLAQDEVLRPRGALMAAVEPAVATVRAWIGAPIVASTPGAQSPVPLAGFWAIEAIDLDEAIRLVAATPCARAGGFIKIRPIAFINDADRWRG